MTHKTTGEAVTDLKEAVRDVAASVLEPFSNRIEKYTRLVRRLPHKVKWWVWHGVPAVIRNQWAAELRHAGLHDEYAKAVRELCRKWGV